MLEKFIIEGWEHVGFYALCHIMKKGKDCFLWDDEEKRVVIRYKLD